MARKTGKRRDASAPKPKALRKQLREAESDLDKAISKRDRAQARVEAMSIIADELRAQLADLEKAAAADAAAKAPPAKAPGTKATTRKTSAKPTAKPAATKPAAKKPAVTEPTATKTTASGRAAVAAKATARVAPSTPVRPRQKTPKAPSAS